MSRDRRIAIVGNVLDQTRPISARWNLEQRAAKIVDALDSAFPATIVVNGPTQWANDDRTVLVSRWPDGTVTVCLRDTPDDIWGPPIAVKPEPDRSDVLA